ncbi:CIC11C00000004932 [Sungouiella intermedia]|uniref:Large ribosomal subunit protein bL27m n=1 Tax=Sungouiella intermedia TaxID=45354 RepID=A0A1L0DJM6_9ASCO|nr:CIC11C00000004932 [[Candida] intermedia]
MSLLRQANQASQMVKTGPAGFLSQIRTATKRAAGSRTNKNDSAGRRLGPKAYENHFVKPGQIIMRQRGTKVHPGENVGIGNDHTIFALEPGYVRFYMDPFHPLRKYVGVALKKDLSLPTPHFDPRVRRFGYIPLEGAEAEKEEAHMSRKEYLAQPELQLRAQKEAEAAAETIAIYQKVISKQSELSTEQIELGASRLHFIASKIRAGESVEFAAEQATFNQVFGLELAATRGDLSAEELSSQSAAYVAFASEFDSKFSVDFAGKIYTPLSAEEKTAAQTSVKGQLDEFKNKILSGDEKETVRKLIGTPGLFSHGEQLELRDTYLPEVLPTTVPGTVVESPGKKLPKGAVTVRTFNEDRSVDTVVRTKEAFA